MLPNILQVISRAIRERHCLEIHFDHQRRLRVVEPHAVYTGDNDELVLDAYQIRGYSEADRSTPFWHPFPLAKINAITQLKEGFAPRVHEGFSPNRPRYRRGLAVVIGDDHSEPLPSRAVSLRPLRDLFRSWR